MVRAVSVNDSRSQTSATPTPHWEDQPGRPHSRGSGSRPGVPGSVGSREGAHPRSGGSGGLRDNRELPPPPEHRYNAASRHARSDSEATGVASSGGYPETTQSGPARRHDYDVQAMETSLASPRAVTRNPIPAPTVTVRSEFPTISRSRQQQTLTCLVTVEVPDSKWRPDPEDLQSAPPLAPAPSRSEETYVQPPSPVRTAPRFYPYESPEVLAEMTENLRNRVENWHGLEFNR